jgi:hypothetical protein
MTAAKDTPSTKGRNRRAYQHAPSTMGRNVKNTISPIRLAKRLVASMRVRCLMLAALAYTAWSALSWISTDNLPSQPRNRDHLRKAAKKAEFDNPNISNEAPRVEAHATDDDDVAQRPGDEFVVIEDNIAADSRAIPMHGDEGWDDDEKHSPPDDAGHMKYEKEANANDTAGPGKTLRERLLKRSLEAKARVSQMLKTVTPVENPRYIHHQNPHTQTEIASRSCEQNDAFVGIPIDEGNGRAWVPPRGFPTNTLKKWDNEYNAAMLKIKEAPFGGSELQQLAKNEVDRLRALRHDLFCGEM